MKKNNEHGYGELEKALRILEIVCSEKEFSAKLIAEKLGVNERTGRRYIKNLRFAFEDKIVEIKRGIYKWEAGLEFDEKFFGSSGIRLLYALSEFGKKIGVNKEFWNEFEKILSYSQYGEKKLNKILYEDTVDTSKIEKIKLKLEKAIKDGKCVKFNYLKYKKFYTVEPYQLIFNDGIWYLLCVDTNDKVAKTFAIDNFDNLTILDDEPFLKTKNMKKILPLAENIESVWQISSEENFKEVIVEVLQKISSYFKQKNFFYNQEILAEYENGNLKIRFFVKNKEDFKLQVLKWLPNIKIIEPDEYKEYFEEILEEAINLQRVT